MKRKLFTESDSEYGEELFTRSMDTLISWANCWDLSIVGFEHADDKFRKSTVYFMFNTGEHEGRTCSTTFHSVQQNRKPSSRMLTKSGKLAWHTELCKNIGGDYIVSYKDSNYGTMIEYTVMLGSYRGYTSRAIRGVIQRAIKNGNTITGFQNLTEESKTRYMYDLAESEGYTVVKLPEGLKVTNKIKLICPSGHEREMIWDNFQRGARCAECKLESKGEKQVVSMLSEKGVNFVTQYPTKPIDGGRPQFFDFYLPDKGVAIEYNGRQHYEPVDVFGGEEGFVKTKERDKRKAQYCKDNNIELINIHYSLDKKEIEELLNNSGVFVL